MKRFLYPSTGKIISFILLIYPTFIVILVLTSGMNVDCARGQIADYCGYNAPPLGIELGLWPALIVSVVVDYLFTCLIFHFISAIRNKKQIPPAKTEIK